MRVMVDTNVALRAVTTPGVIGPEEVGQALAALTMKGYSLSISGQTVVELWAVMTRPKAANGLEMEPLRARQEIDTIMGLFDIVADPPELLTTWLDLCTRYQVRGRQVFDAKIVALMLACGMTQLVTLNPTDFRRFTEIELFVPGQAA